MRTIAQPWRLAGLIWRPAPVDFEQARIQLQTCLKLRPDDAAAWKASLDRSVAAADCTGARQAIEHLGPDALAPADAAELSAWFCRQRRDVGAERKALEALIQIDPGRSIAFARLAELLERAGDRPGAARLRDRKAELDAARDRYNRLYREDRYADHLFELAELAERLGRWFEARGFWEMVQAQEPKRADAPAALARLDTIESKVASATLETARLVANEADRPSPRDGPAPNRARSSGSCARAALRGSRAGLRARKFRSR